MSDDQQRIGPLGPELPDPSGFSDGIAKGATAPQPQPVTAAAAQILYDQIYTRILAKDPTTLRLQREVERCEKRMRYQMHLRYVAGAGIRANARMLRLKAEDELRKQLGVRHLPGFKPRSETSTQFLQRMKRRFHEIEKQEREAVQAAEKATLKDKTVP